MTRKAMKFDGMVSLMTPSSESSRERVGGSLAIGRDAVRKDVNELYTIRGPD